MKKGIGPQQLGSPLKQTRGRKRGKKSSGPDYSKTETFNDYKSAASVFSDFNPGTDTVFVGNSLDFGAANRKAGYQARVSADKGASSAIPSDEKMYRTTNASGQQVYTSVRKYNKK